MNTRIKKLREQSLNAINRISHERALLITDFYESDIAGQVSIPMQRALAFEYILEHKHICINDGELIVGERGEAPKATPTYPEICLHSIDDLETLDSRPKVSFIYWMAIGKMHMKPGYLLSFRNSGHLAIQLAEIKFIRRVCWI